MEAGFEEGRPGEVRAVTSCQPDEWCEATWRICGGWLRMPEDYIKSLLHVRAWWRNSENEDDLMLVMRGKLDEAVDDVRAAWGVEGSCRLRVAAAAVLLMVE